MPRLPRLLLLVALALLLSGVAFGCRNGGGKKEPTATATAAATETPTEGVATPAETPAGAAALPFDSFHYTVDLEITVTQPGEEQQTFVSGSVEGDYVAPDSHSYTNSFEFAGLSGTQDVIIIGPDGWLREGEGAWVAAAADSPEIVDTIDLTSVDPGFLSASDLADNISALSSEDETMNGLETRRYHIPKEAVETLRDLLGDDFLGDASGLQDFEMTVWLDKATNGLVRAELTATADPSLLAGDSALTLPAGSTISITMTINLTQVNDGGITIEPPI